MAGHPQRSALGQIVGASSITGRTVRRETGLLLGVDGHSPGDLDYVYFIRDELDPASRTELGL